MCSLEDQPPLKKLKSSLEVARELRRGKTPQGLNFEDIVAHSFDDEIQTHH